MLLSTLRDYIGKMGGDLVLTARFPDREPVKIKVFADIAGGGKRMAFSISETGSMATPQASKFVASPGR